MPPTPVTASDLRPILTRAALAAARHCRRHPLPWYDREDLAHDLIVDLLGRARHHDPARSSFATFAAICLQHHAGRLEGRALREHLHRQTLSLDDALPGDRLTVADTLSTADSLGAWLGQDDDPVGQFERRHDLDHALGTLPADAVPLCASLLRPGAERARPGLSRSTVHRRMHDLRMRLLAAGLDRPVTQNANRLGR